MTLVFALSCSYSSLHYAGGLLDGFGIKIGGGGYFKKSSFPNTLICLKTVLVSDSPIYKSDVYILRVAIQYVARV